MRLLRRILVTVALTFAAIFVGVYWVAPIALSFYAASKALPVARIVPTELNDHSVSLAPGTKLSYLGYEFEVPWNDLDESKTERYPKNKPDKSMAVLPFRSGLRLRLTSAPPRVFGNQFAADFKVPPQKLEAIFGHGSASSDYVFVKSVYTFTPDKMHFWSLSTGLHYREDMLLMIKSIMPAKAAETGIFYVQNEDYKGFQQGDPRTRPEHMEVDLYSDDGGVEFNFALKDYHDPAGLTQPEINRIVQSLHRAPPSEVAVSAR